MAKKLVCSFPYDIPEPGVFLTDPSISSHRSDAIALCKSLDTFQLV
jgi:hypothetical protein